MEPRQAILKPVSPSRKAMNWMRRVTDRQPTRTELIGASSVILSLALGLADGYLRITAFWRISGGLFLIGDVLFLIGGASVES
jgi:hypothetical protein